MDAGTSAVAEEIRHMMQDVRHHAIEELHARNRGTLSALVREALVEIIADRRLGPGDKLPAEPALASMLTVSRATLRESLGMLEREGVLMRTRGRGTFVVGAPFLRNNLNVNSGVTDLIRAKGRVAGTKDRVVKVAPPSPSVRAALELDGDAQVLVLERVRTASGRPVVFSTDVMPAALVPSHEGAHQGMPESLYEWLRTRCGIVPHHGVARVRPVVATSTIARRLDIRRGSPLLVLEQVDFTAENRPFLYSLEYHVPDAFEITVYRAEPRGAR
jgi:GntR family transcriptional regulator